MLLKLRGFVALALLCAFFFSFFELSTRGELSIIEEQQASEAPNPNVLPDAPDEIERKYDRFHDGNDTHPSWIGSAMDWSGIGKQVSGGGTPYRWGTMISSRFFVTADHTAIPGWNDLRFYRDTSTTNSVDGDLENLTPQGDKILKVKEGARPVLHRKAILSHLILGLGS